MNPLDSIEGILSGGANAANAQQGYYNQIPGIFKKYMNPYMQAGQNGLNNYQQMLSKMMNGPDFINSLMSHYHQSGQYKDMADEATRAANNAAAAGGTLGTGVEQNQLAGTVSKLANADQQQYLQNVMRPEEEAMNGYGNLTNIGYNASSQLMNGLVGNMKDRGALAGLAAKDGDIGMAGILSALGGSGFVGGPTGLMDRVQHLL